MAAPRSRSLLLAPWLLGLGCLGGTASGAVLRSDPPAAPLSSAGQAGAATPAAGSGTATPAATPPAATPPAVPAPASRPPPGRDPSRWLHTDGNHIRRTDGTVWTARGLNFPDMRSCGACVGQPANAALSVAQVDEMVDVWGAGLLRMTLEAHAPEQTIMADAGYLAAVRAVVDRVASKKDVYIMLTVFTDPGLTAQGWPTAPVDAELARLATVFADYPCVILAPSNEPSGNEDQKQDPQVWDAMNAAVAAVRAAEDGAGKPHHLVAVQGTGSWARFLSYYVAHPIAAGNGDNVIYESHAYLAQADFDRIFGDCAKVRPVLIGEYGPLVATADDIRVLEERLARDQIPSMMWTFHSRCGPLSMLTDDGGSLCEAGHVLARSSWGEAAKARLPVLQAMDAARAKQP